MFNKQKQTPQCKEQAGGCQMGGGGDKKLKGMKKCKPPVIKLVAGTGSTA